MSSLIITFIMVFTLLVVNNNNMSVMAATAKPTRLSTPRPTGTSKFPFKVCLSAIPDKPQTVKFPVLAEGFAGKTFKGSIGKCVHQSKIGGVQAVFWYDTESNVACTLINYTNPNKKDKNHCTFTVPVGVKDIHVTMTRIGKGASTAEVTVQELIQ
jgi:hypothetical protein